MRSTKAKMIHTRKTILAALGLVAALLAEPQVADQQGPDRAHSQSVMKSLAVAFRGIEQSIPPKTGGRLAASAAGLREAAELLHEVEVEQNGHLQEEFAARGKRLRDLAVRLEAAAKTPGPLLLEELENARAACVACHVVFRKDNGGNRSFPARANTISGEVTILSTEKVPLGERADVVVFLDALDRVGEAPFAPPLKHPVISQKHRTFTPRVLPVLRGTAVDFPNDDDIFHNVFSLSRPCCFDLDIYERGTVKTFEFPKTGLVKVYCNLHPEMVSNILVLNNPYFAVSDSRGFFVITGVPDGEYVLRSWYEFGDETSRPVVVGGGQMLDAAITVQETKAVAAHKNKFGKPYRNKY